MSEFDDYFDYIINVLGVKAVHIEPVDGLTKASLLVRVENLVTYNSEEKELLAKMLGALKIDTNKIMVLDMNDIQKIDFDFEVRFVDRLNQDRQQQNSLLTYSPRYLTANPTSKKQAWSDLQKVIEFFRIKTT